MFELKTIEKMHRLTWEELVELEPQLDGLLFQVELSRPTPDEAEDFNYEVCWGRFKQPIANLVGYLRRDNCDPRLKTNAAYDVAYWKLWHALHD
jgi:hypothetical protein